MVPGQSPSLAVPAPFFLVAPFGLAAAGFLLSRADGLTLLAINLPSTVAITHAVVLGWLTTFMMGAIYQLGPAVLGGKLLSERLARIQLVTHVLAVSVFVWAMHRSDTTMMVAAGIGLIASFVLFFGNAVPAVWGGARASVPGMYLRVSISLLAGTAALGLLWVMALKGQWFPITMGRLAAHAHVGLVGWLSLTTMGVSYQLIPMFSVIPHTRVRAGLPALVLTALGLAVFASVMATDPRPAARIIVSLFLIPGPVVWAVSIFTLMRSRARRRLDVQGRATFVSLGFLAVTIILGIGAALGTPFTPAGEPARWLLAYTTAGLCGWLGTTLIGNSYKIVPFLVWFHRYQALVGKQPVPLMTDMYSEAAANAVLAANAVATAVVVIGALAGDMSVLHAGGLCIMVVAAGHAMTLLSVFLPKHAPHALPTGVTKSGAI